MLGISINWYFIDELPELIITIFIKNIIKKLKEELKYLEAKSRFIKEYIEGDLDINKKSKETINLLLTKKDYPLQEDSFDYLLRLPIYSFTLEKINELLKQCETKKKELLYYKSKTSSELWKIDLAELLKKLNLGCPYF